MSFAQTGFLGRAPRWYVNTLFAMLGANLLLSALAGPAITGWVIVGEFIFTLAMALKCYPLAPGGVIALEAVLLKLTTPDRIYEEAASGFPVILLLLFMITAIYFMRELLILVFSRVLALVRSQVGLALLFCLSSAVLSAFLDALTVLAVLISVAVGFFGVQIELESDREQFRAALRGLMMHAAVGTALGGVTTLVGEPQNLLVARSMNWSFGEFFVNVAPVSLPVLAAGIATCLLVERFGLFGFGTPIPAAVRSAIIAAERRHAARRTSRDRWRLGAQGACGILLVVALTLHLAEVGLVGLMIVILLTALLGVTDEHELAEGFKGSVPFIALLMVFFAVVAVIHDQNLFRPVIAWVLARDPVSQPAWLYLANGFLSAVSDNVFVATVYVTEIGRAFDAHLISAGQMSVLAVAVNTGTNIPSVATPNGQAAFLFLLTSSIAPLIRLSYGRMVWMALPYFVVLTAVGLVAVVHLSH